MVAWFQLTWQQQ